MKLNVIHRKIFGKNRFYPKDEFTKRFISICRSDRNPQISFTELQIKLLKELGFEVEIHLEYSL
jgi:hypothetical protein